MGHIGWDPPGHVVTHNSTYTLREVPQLVDEALSVVICVWRQNAVGHVVREA